MDTISPTKREAIVSLPQELVRTCQIGGDSMICTEMSRNGALTGMGTMEEMQLTLLALLHPRIE